MQKIISVLTFQYASKCLEPLRVLAKSHQWPRSTQTSLGSLWHHNRRLWLRHIVSRDSIESNPDITRSSGGLLSFYLFKLHKKWIQSLYFILLYIYKPTYIDKVVKIAYLSGDLTVRILNLNDNRIEIWNYIQQIRMQEPKSISCTYWHKYCMEFDIGIFIVKPVT